MYRPHRVTVAANLFDDDSLFLSDSSDTWLQGNTFRDAHNEVVDEDGWMAQGAMVITAERTVLEASRPPGWPGFFAVALASLLTFALLLLAGRRRNPESPAR